MVMMQIINDNLSEMDRVLIQYMSHAGSSKNKSDTVKAAMVVESQNERLFWEGTPCVKWMIINKGRTTHGDCRMRKEASSITW